MQLYAFDIIFNHCAYHVNQDVRQESECYCGHYYSLHTHPVEPELPAKGGCRQTSCSAFHAVRFLTLVSDASAEKLYRLVNQPFLVLHVYVVSCG